MLAVINIFVRAGTMSVLCTSIIIIAETEEALNKYFKLINKK